MRNTFCSCGSLTKTCQNLSQFTLSLCKTLPQLSDILLTFTKPNPPQFSQFLIDCSVIPEVISLTKLLGTDALYNLFKVTRTWCYSLHRDRLKILGRWEEYKPNQ